MELQESLKNKTYKTSPYEIFNIVDKGKEREIYKLPFYPDRIAQWSLMMQIEGVLMKSMPNFICAALPSRGIHYALDMLDGYLKDEYNTKYCLKIDIKKFFPNVDHEILKSLLRKKFKDEDLLWLMDEIIDSMDGDKGIPIGNYTSQLFGNFYLTYFDHWIKEYGRIKYVVRYMDDIVILHHDKNHLHKLKREMDNYLRDNLKLEIKENWQVFPTRVRGIDFVGYRHFGDYILLRKSTAKRMKRKMTAIYNKVSNGGKLTYSEWCSINSYGGWLLWGNCYNLYNKYIKPLRPYGKEYYDKNIKNAKKKQQQKEEVVNWITQ